MFEKLVKINCWSNIKFLKQIAENLLEKLYCCEINCTKIDKSVLFAHHGRGCTIVASKICENVVIFQNVSVGSNLKYNKVSHEWENVGNPVIGKNVILADGAKVFGPITIGKNSVVGAGAIITKNIPENSIAFGVNQYKHKDRNYDLIFNSKVINHHEINEANNKLIADYHKKR